VKDLRVAAAMMRSVVGDKTGNLGRARRLISEAAGRGARLIVLPEACLSGYTIRQPMAAWAEPVPGPLTAALQDMASEFGLSILAGLVEGSPEGSCFLTQIMVGPSGLQAVYRKTHLGPPEQKWFFPGDQLGLAEAMGVRFGLQLCYEGHFPDISLSQALKGADVVLIPHASPREEPGQKLERWLRYLPARAYDNTVFVVACNQVGDNGQGLIFAGAALIINPKGEVLARAAGTHEDLIIADLKAADLTRIRQARMGYFLPFRRPDLYGPN